MGLCQFMPEPTLEQKRQWGRDGVLKREANRAKRNALPWADKQLIRVREHVARLDRSLENAVNTVDILRLATALSKLYEVAGLPKAGAYRPTEAKRPRSTGFTPAPQDIESGQ